MLCLTNCQLKDNPPSFGSSRTLFQKIDSLPSGPEWECVVVSVQGKGIKGEGKMVTEEVELWRHNPVECVRELLANPAFKDKCRYAPRKAFTNQSRTERVYGEMWMGKWWWKIQVMHIVNH